MGGSGEFSLSAGCFQSAVGPVQHIAHTPARGGRYRVSSKLRNARFDARDSVFHSCRASAAALSTPEVKEGPTLAANRVGTHLLPAMPFIAPPLPMHSPQIPIVGCQARRTLIQLFHRLRTSTSTSTSDSTSSVKRRRQRTYILARIRPIQQINNLPPISRLCPTEIAIRAVVKRAGIDNLALRAGSN
jgi:hypothetical protein